MIKNNKKKFTRLLITTSIFNSFALATVPTVPTAPGLSIGVTDINDSTIRINFKDNSDNETGFKIIGDINMSLSNNDETTAPYVYKDISGLTCNKVYKIQAVAYNAVGDSTPSDLRSFNIHTTFGTTCPSVVSIKPNAPGLAIGITDINSTAVRLNFKDNSDNETGFKILGNGINITIPSNDETKQEQVYTNLTGLTCDSLYQIKAVAFNMNGDSTESDSRDFRISSTFGISCGTPANNIPPVANAGIDKNTKLSESINILGTGVDNDGTVVAYEWKEGINVLANSALVNYTATSVGNHTLTLTVTDDDGATHSDEMIVTVTEATNDSPVPETINPVNFIPEFD